MEKLITQAPIQVRPDTAAKHERLFPFFCAEALNRIEEYQTGREARRVDMWNTTGDKIDSIYAQTNRGESRFDFNGRQIDARYELTASYYGLVREGRFVVRDDMPDYVQVVKEQTGKFIENGIFVVKAERFTNCIPCDKVIAPVAAGINKCPTCHFTELGEQTKIGLFIDLSKKRKSEIKERTTIRPKYAAYSFNAGVDMLPEQLQIAKQRVYGVGLTEFGVDGDLVLDPKIALAMSNLVTQEMGLGEIDLMVQGVDSLVNTVPFTALLDPKHIEYAALGLIPKYSGDEVTLENAGFYSVFLPLAMMVAKNNLAVGQKSALYSEYQKTRRKFENSIAFLSRNPGFDTISLSQGDLDQVAQINTLLINHDCRNAMLGFRDFAYQTLSGKYVTQSREAGKNLATEQIAQLKNTYRLIYGG